MSGIDRVGGPPPSPEDREADLRRAKANAAAGLPGAPKFDDVLRRGAKPLDGSASSSSTDKSLESEPDSPPSPRGSTSAASAASAASADPQDPRARTRDATEDDSQPSDSHLRDNDDLELNERRPEDSGLASAESTRALDPFLAPRPLAGSHKLPQELVTRLVEAMRLTTHSQTGKTTLQMDLKGSAFDGMTIRLERHQGRVSGLFLVDRLATKDAVEAQLVGLRERLEAQGVQVGELRVEFRSRLARDADGSPNQHRSQQDRSRDGGPSDVDAGSNSGPSDGRATEAPERRSESETDYSV